MGAYRQCWCYTLLFGHGGEKQVMWNDASLFTENVGEISHMCLAEFIYSLSVCYWFLEFQRLQALVDELCCVQTYRRILGIAYIYIVFRIPECRVSFLTSRHRHGACPSVECMK